MALTITIVAAVLLTLLVIVVSRWGTADHQEELNTHEDRDDRVTTDPDDLEPKADRPAGPGAEAMGADVGHPSTRPEQER